MKLKCFVITIVLFMMIGCQTYNNRGETLKKGEFEVDVSGSIVFTEYEDFPDVVDDYHSQFVPYLGFRYGLLDSLSFGAKYSPMFVGEIFEIQILNPYLQYGKKWGRHGLGVSSGLLIGIVDYNDLLDSLGFELSACYRYSAENWAVYSGLATSVLLADLYIGGEIKYKSIKLYCSAGTGIIHVLAGDPFYININPGIAFVF